MTVITLKDQDARTIYTGYFSAFVKVLKSCDVIPAERKILIG